MSDLHIHQWQQRVLVRRARNTHDRTPYASPQGKTLAILFLVHGTFVTLSGFTEGECGVAETLSTARKISVHGLEEAGIVSSSRGKVRLLKPDELPADWDPISDPRLTAWEIVHQLVHSLEADGEGSAAALVAKLGAKAEIARELAYRLYVLCERKKCNAEALSDNGLVQSWPEITRLAREGGTPVGKTRQKQREIYEGSEE